MDYEEANILIFGLITATILGVITSIIGTMLLDVLQERNIPIAWGIVCLILVLIIFWNTFGKKRLEFPNPKEFRHVVKVDMLELAKHILKIRKKQGIFGIWTLFAFHINPNQDRKKIESVWFDFLKFISGFLSGFLVYLLSMRVLGIEESSVPQTIVIFISSAIGYSGFNLTASIIHNRIYLPRAFSLYKKARLDINPGTLYDPDVVYLVFDSKSNEITIYYNKEQRKEEALHLVKSAEGKCSRD